MAVTSTRKLIHENLVSSVGTISKAGGYNFDLSSKVVKPYLVQIDQIAGGQMPFVTVTRVREDIVEGPSGYYRGHILFRVQGYVQSVDFDLINEDLEKLLWDVRKMVMVDKSRGGRACNTIINSIEDDEGILASYNISMFEMLLTCWYDYPATTP